MKDWWRSAVMWQASGEGWAERAADGYFTDRAVDLGVSVEEVYTRWSPPRGDLDIAKLDQDMLGISLRRIRRSRGDDGRVAMTYTSDDAIVDIQTTGGRGVIVYAWALGTACMNDLSTKLSPILSGHFTPEDVTNEKDSGAVHMLTTEHGHYDFARTRAVGVPLCRANYSASVLDAYDHVSTFLPAKKPPGRMVIFEGVPGTGKTHAVMGLVNELRTKCAFVLVPPSALTELTSPSLLPPLEHFIERERRRNRKVVFVIEDADECLLPRGSDNMSSIATLLNLADGILGAVLDVRIVATTNAKKVEIDEAILRDGRLLARVDAGLLTAEEACATFQYHMTEPGRGILPDGTTVAPARPFEKPTSLARVYTALSKAGWRAPEATEEADGDEDDDEDYGPTRRRSRRR